MSDKMRWRYETPDPVIAAVDSVTVIEVGDLVWQDWCTTDVQDGIGLKGKTKSAFPASMCNLQIQDITSEQSGPEQLQEKFAALFLGVAMRRSRSGDTDPIRVATTGVFEFDCPSGIFELGDLVGPGMSDPLAGLLANQWVMRVVDQEYAIGRVAKFEHEPRATVFVEIRSKVMRP